MTDLVIITSHLKTHIGECGKYSCQLAATIVSKYSNHRSIVIEVDFGDGVTTDSLVACVRNDLGFNDPIFGFSLLKSSSIADYLFTARQLKQRGYKTFVAGAEIDYVYLPEVGHKTHEHRFQGNTREFDFLFEGPAEHIIPVLDDIQACKDYAGRPGVTTVRDSEVVRGKQLQYRIDKLVEVDWGNLLILGDGLIKREIQSGVVLAQRGCPSGSQSKLLAIDPPVGIYLPTYEIQTKGCSFCHYGGPLTIPLKHVLSQIKNIPVVNGKRNFYLSHQNPFPLLPKIIEQAEDIGTIHLMSIPGFIINQTNRVRSIIMQAREKRITLDLSCIGFESFTPNVLRNLNKNTSVEQNIREIEVMIDLENKFPNLHITAGCHGLIIPTPWHTSDDLAKEFALLIEKDWMKRIYGGAILERQLRITHTGDLSDWIRFVEENARVAYQRNSFGQIEWYTEDAETWRFDYSRNNKTRRFVAGEQ
jgi:hypothetical protein